MSNRLTDRDIERVKESADIVAVIRGYVHLVRSGFQLKGKCPFHTEKTPSFMVTPARADKRGFGFWKCFGCGKGGDVITFLREIEGSRFTDVVRELAQRFGVQLDGEARPHVADLGRRLAEEAAWFWTAYQHRLRSLAHGCLRAEQQANRAIREIGEQHVSEWIRWWAAHGPDLADALWHMVDVIEEAEPQDLIAEYRRLCGLWPTLSRHCRSRFVEARDAEVRLIEAARKGGAA